MNKELLTLSDGRNLEVFTSGQRASSALVFHHGALGSAEDMELFFEAARDSDVFLIAITRPGYEQSTRRPGRRAHNYVEDTCEVLDHFGVTKFVSVGWSSGGPVMISDQLDGRCVGGVAIASDSPMVSEDWQDYLAKYPPANPHIGEAIDFDFEKAKTIEPAEVLDFFGTLLSKRDRELFTEETKVLWAAGLRRATTVGIKGVLDDFESDGADWGIDLSSIKNPIAIFQGTEDRMCTPARGHYLHDHLPNSELILIDGQGHISIGQDFTQEIVDKALSFLN